jgi:signal transduction histidine kinase
MLWVWRILFVAMAALVVYLLVLGIRHFIRGFRQGLTGDGQSDRPTLRGVLFRTVLVTLLVLFLLMTALLEHDQRDQQPPVSEGMQELRDARSHGATWLDSEAQAAIEAALKEAVGGNPAGSGELDLSRPADVRLTPLSPSSAALLRRQGWAVGTGPVGGQAGEYVAWLTSKDHAVFYGWVTPPWYMRLWGWLFALLFAIAVLSPFAAVAAWHLNRRIVKPVRQVAEASVALADGSRHEPITENGPAELATMARSFNRLSDRLDEAEAAQREFVASVNHELKTPLTSLQGYGELLSEGSVSAEEAGPVVLAETARLERLVGDLLDSARMDSGTFSVRDEAVSLDCVADAVLQRCQGPAREFGISLEVRHEPLGEALVRADGDRLVQVVGNLVENALRCTPAGGSVHIVVQPPSTVRVADTGPGFESEDVAHAFERFYLYERCGKDRPVGTGLGLSIVEELTEAMGGSVSVTSEPGAGSVFSVELRAAEPAAAGWESDAGD